MMYLDSDSDTGQSKAIVHGTKGFFYHFEALFSDCP